MMAELGFKKDVKCVPLTLTLHVAGNHTYSSRATHVVLRYFYICEIIKEEHVSIHNTDGDAAGGSGDKGFQQTAAPVS